MAGHRFPAEGRKRLNDENRRKRQPAEGIIERMAPSPNEVVADLGAGIGYISIPLASRVGKVFALDAQQDMLDEIMANAPFKVKGKIEAVKAELPKLPFEGSSLDRAILVNVAHEVEDKPLLVSELRRCLKKGGKLTIVDFPKKETSFGPPLHDRMSEEEMLAAFAPFKEVRRWSFPEFYQLELER